MALLVQFTERHLLYEFFSRNCYLINGHMMRLHHLMSKRLKLYLDRLLKLAIVLPTGVVTSFRGTFSSRHSFSITALVLFCTACRDSLPITHCMLEVSILSDWFNTTDSVIEFRRCLIQAISGKNQSLLQIPHVDEDIVRHCHRFVACTILSLGRIRCSRGAGL